MPASSRPTMRLAEDEPVVMRARRAGRRTAMRITASIAAYIVTSIATSGHAPGCSNPLARIA
ncbi:hypothetical protein CRM94_27280 [Burkholderia gladioli]|uniref:Uncharacterized protein n=2 Tax=Burkholderia gladioli TaxID=28095 RepID=A0A0M2QEA4_BURGA|nr:hypothetical protein XF14_19750 [Burkholderia gladioli]PEH38128.1 hypothetical protein CRM94_27280 [Burkholderia gladioli]